LTFSNAYWKAGHNRFAKDEANHTAYLKYLRNPIRPTNPARPNEPLAPQIFATNFEGAAANELKDNLRQFQYARGPMDGRGLTGFKFPYPQHPLNADPQPMALDGFSVLDEQPQRAHPDVLYAGSMSPFYVSDESGQGAYKYYMEQRYRAIVEAKLDPIVRFGALGLLFSKVTKKSMIACLDEKVSPPSLVYLLVQPFVRVYTQGGVWAEGGLQTARLLFKWSDLSFQYQATTKKWMAHYTLWLDCLISQPAKIAYLTDIKCAGYVGGMDDLLYMHPPLHSSKLDFRSSMFVFDCGSTFSRDYARKTANPMSLFGKFNPAMFSYRFNETTQNSLANPHPPYPSFYYYNFLWNFTDINKNSTFKNMTYKQMRSGRPYYPGMLFMGKHKSWNPMTKEFSKIHRGTGPLKNFDPPLKPVLNGKILFKGTAFE
jgi:hypothetical protein